MKTTGVALTEGETVERSKKEGWVDLFLFKAMVVQLLFLKT